MAERTKPAGCCTPKAVKPLPPRRAERITAVAKALADTNRVEILRLLARQPGPLCACDVVEHFDLSQPTVSHHLKVLREAGLLSSSRRGLWTFYAPHPRAAKALAAFTALLE